MPVHLFGVEVGDEEADVVALDGLPPQDDKALRPPHHEPHELVAQQPLDLVGLRDVDSIAYPKFLSQKDI